VLREASVRKCDLFIAVNHEENDNVVAAMLAKKLGARKSIARIDNNEYLEPNNKEMFIDMGIDYLFYPEKVAAREVINLLGHTSTTEYVDFSSGKLSLVVFRLEPASPLVGEVLTGFDDDQAPLSYRTVAITRGGQTIIPREGEQFMEGDVIYVIARQDAVREVMEFSGQSNIEIKNMMILGGSRIGIPHRHRVAGRGEHQTDRLQRREGLPAGRDARQDDDDQRGRPQHRGDDGGGAFEHGRLRCRDGAQRDQHPGGDARQAHGGQEGDRRGRESQLHKPRRVDRHRHDHQPEAW